ANHEAGAGWPERMGLQGPMVAPNDGYETADGKLMLTTGTPLQFERFCGVVGRADLLEDPRFATNNDRMTNSEAFKATINETLAQRTDPNLGRGHRAPPDGGLGHNAEQPRWQLSPVRHAATL
ncbi:MAG: hypothetical protein HOF11_16490, partial [Rhodospirillaceae bacterium]|nr:hypothetical protein [Rhodospirillaceae bacterium]